MIDEARDGVDGYRAIFIKLSGGNGVGLAKNAYLRPRPLVQHRLYATCPWDTSMYRDVMSAKDTMLIPPNAKQIPRRYTSPLDERCWMRQLLTMTIRGICTFAAVCGLGVTSSTWLIDIRETGMARGYMGFYLHA